MKENQKITPKKEEKQKILKRRKQENPNNNKKDGREALGRGIQSPHLIHEILWWEWVVISYNQEKKMVGHL